MFVLTIKRGLTYNPCSAGYLLLITCRQLHHHFAAVILYLAAVPVHVQGGDGTLGENAELFTFKSWNLFIVYLRNKELLKKDKKKNVKLPLHCGKNTLLSYQNSSVVLKLDQNRLLASQYHRSGTHNQARGIPNRLLNFVIDVEQKPTGVELIETGCLGQTVAAGASESELLVCRRLIKSRVESFTPDFAHTEACTKSIVSNQFLSWKVKP